MKVIKQIMPSMFLAIVFSVLLFITQYANAGNGKIDIKALKIACNEENDASSCFQLAKVLLDDKRSSRDKLNGLIFADKACGLGNSTSCMKVGKVYGRGKAFPKDLKKKCSYLIRGCELGNENSCEYVAIWEKGFPQMDMDNLERHLADLCDSGASQACSNLAYILLECKSEDKLSSRKQWSSMRERHVAAGKYGLKACKLKNGYGCYNYSVAVNIDQFSKPAETYQKRVKYLKIGCELENPFSCSKLAGLHEGFECLHGKNGAAEYCLANDAAAAVSYYEKACDYGSKQSCFKMHRLKASMKKNAQ